MNQYEYVVLHTKMNVLAEDDLARRMNGLGAEGWRLVSTVSHQHHGYSHEVHLFFVREKAVTATLR